MWSTGPMRPRTTRPLSSRLATAVLAVAALAACGDDGDQAGDTDIEGVVVEDGQSNDHVDDPVYDADPPSGGDHAAVWLNCDFYEVEVPNPNAVHTLEHGVVWFAHDPDLPDDELDTLRALYEEQPDRVLVSPYPGLDSPVVAVAWERRLEVDTASDPRLGQFLETFVNGAQAPEPSAACTGGLGQS